MKNTFTHIHSKPFEKKNGAISGISNSFSIVILYYIL